MKGIRLVDKSSVEKQVLVRGKLTSEMYPLLRKLNGQNCLEVNPRFMGFSVSGVRHVIKQWNEKYPDNKMILSIRDSRTSSPVVFIGKEQND